MLILLYSSHQPLCWAKKAWDELHKKQKQKYVSDEEHKAKIKSWLLYAYQFKKVKLHSRTARSYS